MYKATTGEHQVVGDGMVRKGEHVKQGDLYVGERRTGVRASIVATKRRNGRGAKGGRKVGELQLVTRNTHRYQVAARLDRRRTPLPSVGLTVF